MSKEHSFKHWQHSHDFTHHNHQGERNTLYVLCLTVVTMLVEIVAGSVYGSMALLADGWHMGTHAAAFLITLFAYAYARKNKDNPRFAFGTGKVSVLGGFTSAVALGLVALIMAGESLLRLFNPHAIQFQEAIIVAIIGLLVNIVSAFLLKDHHGHHHHGEGHHHGDDHNLKAAYFHVLADALTSLLAIGALLMGKYFGLSWLDPLMGIVGAVIITRWAWGLLTQTAPILLDKSIDQQYQQEVVNAIESLEDHQVTDIHIWSISADHYAAVIALVSHKPLTMAQYKKHLAPFSQLAHLTVEVNTCTQLEYFDPQHVSRE